MAHFTLADLVTCDIYRDGGSYEATFRTEGGGTFSLALRVGPWDHPRDRHYVDLFEAELARTGGLTPVGKGSAREQEILAALNAWLERHTATGASVEDVDRLREMIDEIPRRVPR